jgi:CRP-like cAMP-binding protein
MQETERLDESANKFAQLLHNVLFFNIFSLRELSDILGESRLIKWKKFKKGATIFSEGTFDQHFYIVIQGTVEIVKSQGIGQGAKVGEIRTGEVFGEGVVSDPGTPRRASASVAGSGDAVLCEIDGTLMATVPEHIRAKFMKKFLDLIVERLKSKEGKTAYYEDIIRDAEKNGVSVHNEYFVYSIETAVNANNRLTQFIKYTDFLIAKKIDSVKALPLLKNLLAKANKELDQSFQAV